MIGGKRVHNLRPPAVAIKIRLLNLKFKRVLALSEVKATTINRSLRSVQA